MTYYMYFLQTFYQKITIYIKRQNLLKMRLYIGCLCIGLYKMRLYIGCGFDHQTDGTHWIVLLIDRHSCMLFSLQYTKWCTLIHPVDIAADILIFQPASISSTQIYDSNSMFWPICLIKIIPNVRRILIISTPIFVKCIYSWPNYLKS